jgi:hypothetical protein
MERALAALLPEGSMSESTPPSRDPHSAYSHSTLRDRVRGRVAEVTRQIDNKARKRTSRLHPTLSEMPVEGPGAHPDLARDAKSLLNVYRELQSTYRLHRAVTGQPTDPALRAAVVKFQKDPSIASLTYVAAFLEDRQILPW